MSPLRPSENVCTVGRFVSRADALECSWSASTLRLRFAGTSVTLCAQERGESRYGWTLDGTRGADLTFATDKAESRTFSAPTPGEHELELTKLTEPMLGRTAFFGVEPGPNTIVLDPPPARPLLLVVGDSISAGYGVLCDDPEAPFAAATEDYREAYTGLTAAALGCDLLNVAWSGKGVFTNRGRLDDPLTMSDLWQEPLPDEPGHPRLEESPFAIVINLGTNDFAPEVVDVAPFEEAYDSLVQAILARHPACPLLLTMGPMLTDGLRRKRPRSTTRQALERVARRHASARLLGILEFDPMRVSEGFGADYHPSQATHARMAQELSARLAPFLPGAP